MDRPHLEILLIFHFLFLLIQHHLYDTAYVIAPGALLIEWNRPTDLELAGVIRIVSRHDSNHPIGSDTAGNDRLVIDGTRQHEPIVIIGVLADEVHPARRLKYTLRRRSKVAFENHRCTTNEGRSSFLLNGHASP